MFVVRRNTLPPFWKLGLLLCMFLGLSTPSSAQSEYNAVHVLPSPARVSATQMRSTFRSDVDLVLVNVTVLDRSSRVVSGLTSHDFALLENKNPQTIRYFASDDQPMSLVVIVDASASMEPRFEQARQAALEVAKSANPLDDFAVVTVSDVPRVTVHFGDSADQIEPQLAAIRPTGRTALWDAITAGLEEFKHANYQRKAMIVISDGGDNQSRYTEAEVKSRLEEADVEMYALGMFDPFPRRAEERRGPQALDELSTLTGGRMLFVRDNRELTQGVDRINEELRHQYIVGYYPSNRARDGRWHKLKVSLNGSSSQELHVYSKTGYFAPAD